ncbi:MAG: ribosome assembly factor SBDS [Candidatus Nanoarchaeia archaeon]|nr:ribosome assembly factor SBDS [Candidatus Nanoarchaeia archaeon]
MVKGQIYDKERFSLNLAKLKKGGENFEVSIDSDKAIEFRQGKDIPIEEVIKSENIFSDAKKGLLASENMMQELFNTTDPKEIAKIIIKQGEIQLTSEYRQKLRDEKKKRIIDYIHVNGADPKTGTPHPITRIENAFEEVKIHIDEFKSEDSQIQEIIKKLRQVLPIKFEINEIEVKIPAVHAGKMYSVVKNFAKIIKDEWLNDGSWRCIVELPGGLKNDFFDKLNNLTHGEIEINILKTK